MLKIMKLTLLGGLAHMNMSKIWNLMQWGVFNHTDTSKIGEVNVLGWFNTLFHFEILKMDVVECVEQP